jgi:hypothetical protein
VCSRRTAGPGARARPGAGRRARAGGPPACRARCRSGWSRACAGRRARQPHEAEPLAPLGERRGHAGHRAGAERVVAAEDERDGAGAHGVGRHPGQLRAHGGDGRQELGAGAVERRAVGDAHVAAVGHRVPELPQPLGDAREPHRRRPHVDPPAARAQVHRHADHVHGARRRRAGAAARGRPGRARRPGALRRTVVRAVVRAAVEGGDERLGGREGGGHGRAEAGAEAAVRQARRRTGVGQGALPAKVGAGRDSNKHDECSVSAIFLTIRQHDLAVCPIVPPWTTSTCASWPSCATTRASRSPSSPGGSASRAAPCRTGSTASSSGACCSASPSAPPPRPSRTGCGRS